MRTSLPRRLARTSLAAVLAVLALLPLPALAHGSLDQAHDGATATSGCSAAEYPGSVLLPTSAESRQSFVPSRAGLAGVELCVESIVGVPGPDFTLVVYEGANPAAPGRELARVAHDVGPDLLTSSWVHVDLPSEVPTTPGASYVLGVQPTGGLLGGVLLRWRASCTDGVLGTGVLGSCDGITDAYPRGRTDSLPGNADYAFRTMPLHGADLVPSVAVPPVVCAGLDLAGRATGQVENVSDRAVGGFDVEWIWSTDPLVDAEDHRIEDGRHRLAGLEAGEVAPVPAPRLPADLPAGDGHLLLHADVADEVVESVEDNVAAGSTTVIPCGQPSFEPLSVSIDEDQVLTGFHERQLADLDPAALATLPQSAAEAAAGAAARGSGFSANGFSANGFSANGFSANGFSANGFSANGFSPAEFSANGFSANGFSANGFSANGFSPAGGIRLAQLLADLPPELPRHILVVDVPIVGPGWAERLPGDRPIQDHTLADAVAALPDLTLAEVDLTAVLGSSWLAIALTGGTLDDTPLPDGQQWCDLLADHGFECAAVGVDPGSTSLLGLEGTGFPTFQAPIAAQPLSTIDRTAPFVVRSLPLRPGPDGARFNLEHTRLGQLPADVALSDPSAIFDCSGDGCGETLAALAGSAKDVTVGALLDGLTAAGLAAGVVGDLGLGIASVGNLNLASADWNRANPYRVDPSCPPVTYRVAGRNSGEGPAIDPVVTATTPTGFALVPGTTVLVVDGTDGPAQGEPSAAVAPDGTRTYTFELDAAIAEDFELSFQVCAGVHLGSFDVGSATISGVGIDGEYVASSTGGDLVQVVERTPGVTTHEITAEDNVVIFDHIDRPEEHDSATFEVKTEPGTLYEVNLFVPPGAAYDLLAFGPAASAAGFSANGFSANGFSANGFSANGFSANGFSANGFSANGFSANGFSANGFSPTLPSEGLDDQPLAELAPPDSTGSYVSSNRDDQVETLHLIGNHGDSGSFTFSVVDYGSRSSAPYVLTVQTRRPERNPKLDVCADAPWTLAQPPGQAPPAWSGSTPPRTLFVVNRQVTASTYGAVAAQEGIDALRALAARPEVSGIVLEVDHAPPVRAAYAAWQADWCNPTAANAVATHIRSLVLDQRRAHPTIDTVVVAGGDPVIPDFRLPDHLWTGNESQYVETLLKAVPANNATIAAFAERTLPSLDPYGNDHPAAFGPTLAFPPSAGVSRLVESPAEWAAQVHGYERSDGKLAPTEALVTGYDGFVDGAQAAREVLEGGGVPTRVVTDDPSPWRADDLRQAAFEEAPGLSAINAHTNHWAILSAKGSHDADESEVVTTAEANRLPVGVHVLSNGCHLGTNVTDALNGGPDGPQATRLEDWAQATGRQQGVAVANTGFGIFDTEVVEQGERLQVLYLEELQHARNASLALARAKQRYLATVGVQDAFAYKTLHQLTMFGPGTYALAGATERPEPAPPATTPSIPVSTGPYGVEQEGSACERCFLLGLSRAGTEVSLRDPGADTGHTSVSGYWSAPRSTRTVRRPAGTLSAGVWITEVESTTIADVDPVITRLGKSRAGREAEPQLAAPFPTTFAQVADVGPDSHVTLLHGIAQPTRKDDGAVRADLHLYTKLGAQLLLRPDTTVGCRPHIADVDVAGDQDSPYVVVHATVSERCGPNQRVGVVARDDAGRWHVRDLSRDPSTGRWSGAIRLEPGASGIEDLLVQASNGLGVGHWRNKGDRPLVRSGVRSGVDVAITGDRHPSGVYTGSITGTILGTPGVRYEVLVDDVRRGTYETGQSFVVTGDGVHQLEVIGSDGSLYGRLVAIDASKPRIEWRSPADGASVVAGTPLPVDVTCADVSTGADCLITVAGTTYANGSALPTGQVGSYTVQVTATDGVGNVTTASRSYSVTSRYQTNGFESPIMPKPTLNQVGRGKTVPVKFTVTSDGQTVTDVRIIAARQWLPIDCKTQTPTGGAPIAAVGTNPEYSGFFHFNVTAPSKAGCYELVVRLDDGSTLTAWFRVT